MRYIGKKNVIFLIELIYRVQEAYFHEWQNNIATDFHRVDVQIVHHVIDACKSRLKLDLVKHEALHLLHVNVIWALLEDTNETVRDLNEIRITHNMNVEDQNWCLDDRLLGSTETKLRGVGKFFAEDEKQQESILGRRASFLGESNFKDFRDYLKGTANQLSVFYIISWMAKMCHTKTMNALYLRNKNQLYDGKRDIRRQAQEQLAELRVILRRFQLLALSKISQIERKVKHTLVRNMLLFAKFAETELNQMGDTIKTALIEAASLACDSHIQIGKAEFAMLCTKFGKNKIVTKTLDYIDRKVGKMIDFDQNKSVYIEQASPFNEFIMRMRDENDLISGL